MPFLTLEDLRMKNPNFISTDTEKVADKIQPQILDKRGILDSLNKTGINGVERTVAEMAPSEPHHLVRPCALGYTSLSMPKGPFSEMAFSDLFPTEQCHFYPRLGYARRSCSLRAHSYHVTCCPCEAHVARTCEPTPAADQQGGEAPVQQFHKELNPATTTRT